jgi:uncharacterized protein YdhG (YjbR/CyaY superfamily)
MTADQKSTKSKRPSNSSDTWSDVEKAAARETAKERRAQARRRGSADERAEGEKEVRAKFAEMVPAERAMAEKIHAIVATNAPEFVPRTFYGMPAYSLNGKTICFFQPASKFKVRYCTLGFQPDARIDAGEMWPVAFALNTLTPAGENAIAALVKKAAAG